MCVSAEERRGENVMLLRRVWRDEEVVVRRGEGQWDSPALRVRRGLKSGLWWRVIAVSVSALLCVLVISWRGEERCNYYHDTVLLTRPLRPRFSIPPRFVTRRFTPFLCMAHEPGVPLKHYSSSILSTSQTSTDVPR